MSPDGPDHHADRQISGGHRVNTGFITRRIKNGTGRGSCLDNQNVPRATAEPFDRRMI